MLGRGASKMGLKDRFNRCVSNCCVNKFCNVYVLRGSGRVLKLTELKSQSWFSFDKAGRFS